VRVGDIESAPELVRFLGSRLGGMPGAEEGVLHVAAVWRPPGEDRNVVLRICDATPKSEVDFLLLNVARARADAIVTTGRILREERGVTHDLQGPPGVRDALQAWRRDELHLERPPWLVILTSGRDLDPSHPAFHSWPRPIVFCPDASAPEIARRVQGAPIETVGRGAPDLRSAISYLRTARDARRISIEAGPSTAIDAYSEPVVIDELVLSVFARPAIAPDVAGGELPPTSEIERLLGRRRACFAIEEPSGPWRFERYGCGIV
jgi:riboflavin biosynthesis pyrimidine reductase